MEVEECSALNIWVFITQKDQSWDLCSQGETCAWVRQLSATEVLGAGVFLCSDPVAKENAGTRERDVADMTLL